MHYEWAVLDREHSEAGYLRARMLSALTLLRTGDSHLDRERWSYLFLAEELRRLCEDPKGDARKLFKRAVFNALISNTDDHPTTWRRSCGRAGTK